MCLQLRVSDQRLISEWSIQTATVAFRIGRRGADWAISYGFSLLHVHADSELARYRQSDTTGVFTEGPTCPIRTEGQASNLTRAGHRE